jgi:hypothetical protein
LSVGSFLGDWVVGSLYLPTAFRDAYGLFLVAILFRPRVVRDQKERRLAAAAALSRSGREPQRGLAHDPHLHLHPRHLAIGFNIVFGYAGQLTMFTAPPSASALTAPI